jgi:hypothetical protein
MINVRQFTIDIIKTHKMFFLLDQLDVASEVSIYIKTPKGVEAVDFIDVFAMANGKMLAAWQHPFGKLNLYNVVASANGKTQIINLEPYERFFEIYNRPKDAEYGVFTFCPSVLQDHTAVDGGDWRCDLGYYGPGRFEAVPQLFTSVGEIVYYESPLTVNSVGQIIYMERRGIQDLASEFLNNSVVPTTARTLQECLKLVYEWAMLTREPFFSTDDCALRAYQFLKELGFADEEMKTLDSMPSMQISNWLAGSTDARKRPANTADFEDIQDMFFKRIASSCLSWIIERNPELWDLNEVLNAEYAEFEAGIERFKNYYEGRGEESHPYVHNQLRHFKNKRAVLDSVSSNETIVNRG